MKYFCHTILNSIAILISCITISTTSKAQLPTCDKIYMDDYTAEFIEIPGFPPFLIDMIPTTHLYEFNTLLPTSTTNPTLNTIALPTDYFGGLTVSEVINSGNPTLTYYCLVQDPNTSLLYFSYFNPITNAWVNTGHEAGNGPNIAAGGGFIYGLEGSTGTIYKYNGTGNASILISINDFQNEGPFDLISDCEGNFYLLNLTGTNTPPFLRKYNPNGILVSSWTINNPNDYRASAGFGIIGSNIYVDYELANGQRGMAYGTLGANSVTFTNATAGFDFTTLVNNQGLITGSIIGDLGSCAGAVPTVPTISITAQPTVICEGGTINFQTVISSGGTNPLYQWFVNGVAIPGANNSSFTYSPNAGDVITCQLTSNSICVSEPIAVSAAANYSIQSPVQPTLSYPSLTFCQSGYTIPTYSPTGGSFTASPSNLNIDANTGEINLQASSQGIYTITYTTANTSVCPAESVSTDISIVDGGSVEVSLQYDTLTYDKCIGSRVTLHATGSATTQYAWYPAKYFGSDTVSSNTVQALLRSGENKIFVEAEDDNGCKSSDSITIYAVPCCELMLPNAFTPNGDGLNDIFKPISKIDQSIEAFKIYDRWGNCVYNSFGTSTGWNGTINNSQLAPNGTYFYYLNYTCSNKERFEMKGDISLIR